LLQKTTKGSDNLQVATAEAKIMLPEQHHSSTKGNQWQWHCLSMTAGGQQLVGA